MTVVVTGAASGIGAAVVAALAAGGTEVIGLDLEAMDNVGAFDVRDPDAWAALAAKLSGHRVRGLVNCAGTTWRARLGEVTAEVFAHVHAVNVPGPAPAGPNKVLSR